MDDLHLRIEKYFTEKMKNVDDEDYKIEYNANKFYNEVAKILEERNELWDLIKANLGRLGHYIIKRRDINKFIISGDDESEPILDIRVLYDNIFIITYYKIYWFTDDDDIKYASCKLSDSAYSFNEVKNFIKINGNLVIYCTKNNKIDSIFTNYMGNMSCLHNIENIHISHYYDNNYVLRDEKYNEVEITCDGLYKKLHVSRNTKSARKIY